MKLITCTLTATTLLIASSAVSAHDTPTWEYRPVQFYCYDLPLVLRKQARNHQQFQFSNIGFLSLYYIIFPDVFGAFWMAT